MRVSNLFFTTLRETPSEAEVEGHQFLLRAGYIQPLGAGLYSFLPLGHLVTARIEQIMREEMNAIGGQELTMPVVHPAELWKETGRWFDIGAELVRFIDRSERDMVLAMTHEEVIGDLLRRQIRSYRQLPVMVYQIQTKFRDEPRARGGLIRAREFVMKDAYSAHPTFESLDEYYPHMVRAYFRIFQRCALDVIAVSSDVGMMGGTGADEFMFLSDIGEDWLALCDSCGYAANRQVAVFAKPGWEEELNPLEEVETPGTSTIASLAQFLDIPEERTAKATFFMAGDRLIFAVVRGDMEVNETKLANAVGASELRSARPEELAGAGIVAGYASPIGVHGATIVVDDLVARSPNLVAGANRAGYHLRHTNFPRDYRANVVADIASANEGAACAQCGHPLRLVRGVEVGNTFKLGTKYSSALGSTYLDEQGEAHDLVMGSYGIGVGRLMACVAQAHRDERGLIWPITIAPYQVYLVELDLDDEAVAGVADSLYADLQKEGIEVLYDDRRERAGVKFNDADLLGIPLRVTVSRRTVARNGVEVKRRDQPEATFEPLATAVAALADMIRSMHEEIIYRLEEDAG